MTLIHGKIQKAFEHSFLKILLKKRQNPNVPRLERFSAQVDEKQEVQEEKDEESDKNPLIKLEENLRRRSMWMKTRAKANSRLKTYDLTSLPETLSPLSRSKNRRSLN